MEISLASPRHRLLVLAGCILLGAVIVVQAIELWLENRWSNSQNISLVERGAGLIPSDGSAWDNLGHLKQWSLTNPDLPGAIGDYRRALRDDPRAAHYWMDLASAEEAAGHIAEAADAYIHAESVYPDSAEVAFYHGNFLLRQGDDASAYAQLRRAVRGDPSLLPLAISRAWRATSDANQIVDQLLPPSVNAYLQAIDYFAAIHQCDAALAVWKRLADSKTSVPLASTFPLFDELISQDRGADARHVWTQAVPGAGGPERRNPDSSLIWNGDFHADLSGGGLGWRWTPVVGVYLSFESAPPQGGARALRLDFNGGSNVELSGPYQYVPIEPGETYRFHALMRTDAITTESGPRFSISDPNHSGAVNVVTGSFTGSHGWTPVDAQFVAGLASHFVVIRLIRPPSRLFDNKLAGSVWIADVSLVPAPSNPGPQP